MATKKYPCPEAYRAPLKKRADVEKYLLDRDPYHAGRGDGGTYLFHFDVECSGADLSLENLVRSYRRSGEAGPAFRTALRRPGYRKELRRLHKGAEDRLWNWAIDDARELVQGSDCYKDLWDGTDVDAVWRFLGRSGKHLCLAEARFGSFGGDIDYEEWARELSYRDLLTFYRFVVQCESDFATEKVENEVEYRAAFAFFENYVEGHLDGFAAAWDRAWKTEQAVGLARAILRGVAWSQCGVLADALETAGCGYQPLLDALRHPDPRSRKDARRAVGRLAREPDPKPLGGPVLFPPPLITQLIEADYTGLEVKAPMSCQSLDTPPNPQEAK